MIKICGSCIFNLHSEFKNLKLKAYTIIIK